MELNRVICIGIGGVGTAYTKIMARFLSFQAGLEEPVELWLADGDEFEMHNMERQNCTYTDIGENKAQAEATKLKAEFDLLPIETFTEYITPENVADLIKEGDVVMVGVDNFKTRKVIAEHCATLNNVTLISGGNEDFDGNVQTFVRRNGVSYTANLGDYHDEIANPKDKSPHELGCDEAIKKGAWQLVITNANVGVHMMNMFYLVYKAKDEKELKDLADKAELYFDIKQGAVAPYTRKPLTA